MPATKELAAESCRRSFSSWRSRVEMTPVMNAEDLQKGLVGRPSHSPALRLSAVRRYGSFATGLLTQPLSKAAIAGPGLPSVINRQKSIDDLPGIQRPRRKLGVALGPGPANSGAGWLSVMAAA